jgi:arsenate reductase
MDAYRCLSARVSSFVNLDFEKLDLATLKQKLLDIGVMDGATEKTLQSKAA